MLVEEFERIAAAAEGEGEVEVEVEGIRMELIQGRVSRKPARDGDHAEFIRLLTQSCLRQRPDLWLYAERGLRVERSGAGRARPDGALAPAGGFAGQGEWADAGQVVMVVEVVEVVEVTSSDEGQGPTDRPRAYAQTGIPVYLLIDRISAETLVHTEPDGDSYAQLTRRPFGRTITLPDPVGVAFDTTPLKDWVR